MAELSTTHRALAEALRARLAAIADRSAYAQDSAAHFARLKAISEEIGILRAQLPAPVDPQLSHFLERASFDKALAWLEGQ